jgi:glycosyltransferase involved in cell wall biosynthesis
MRIGVNGRLLLSDKMEGMPRYIYETTKQMALSHPDDRFILFFDRKVDVDFGFPPNVESVIVPWQARHPILWYWWFELMIPLYLWWYKIDVFYSGDGYMSLRTQTPTLMVIHDLAYVHYPEQIQASSLWHYKRYVPQYIQQASSLITVSDYVKNDIHRNFDIPLENIKVAGNAVEYNPPYLTPDIPDFIQQQLDGKPYFLYIGAIHPRKNIINLIKAFNTFNKDKSNKLILAGRMAWKTNEIKEMIQLSADILHVGMVTEKEKYILIRNAIAVTYVSLFEGFGIPILEAMRAGTAVITSNVTSMPEVAGDAALLVNPHDPEDIAKGITSLARDKALREQLIKKGYQQCDKFSWKTSGDIIYKELLRIRFKNQ